MTNEERKLDLENWAEKFGCVIEWLPTGSGGMMYVEYEPPMVEVPEIDGQFAYMVGLHELGHVIHGHTQGRPPFEHKRFYFDNGVLHSEAQAWNWALDVVKEDLEEMTASGMWYTCLSTYLSGQQMAGGRPTRLTNGNRHHVQFIYDEPDDYFWATKDRIFEVIRDTNQVGGSLVPATAWGIQYIAATNALNTGPFITFDEGVEFEESDEDF